MRPLVLLLALGLGFVSSPGLADEGARASLELRISPPFARPMRAPSICPMLALPVAKHWLVGGGYEVLQDYDATVDILSDVSERPVVMSAVRLGGWYRGGAARDGLSFAVGPLAAFSSPSVSVAKVPGALDSGTYIFDFGLDLSVGRVWEHFRLEAYFLPAWSVGRFSTAERSERWSGFTPRLGVALAWLL